MRTFIGIEFDTGLKRSLCGLQDSLKQSSVKGRWKHRDNFHLTLKFLGEVNPATIKSIAKSLEEITGFGSFTLKPGKLGYFAGKDRIRVLWLGLGGDRDKLISLQKKVDNTMEKLGFPLETRPYRPHITLAQDIFTDLDFKVLEKQAATFDYPEVFVDRITVFSSEQIAGRRVYTSVAEIPLE